MTSTIAMPRRAGLVLLMLTLPLLAAESPESDLEHNASLLLRWKQEPERYARLKRDYRAFVELPSDRQAQLRKLDHDLAALEATQQKHLLQVLDRYQAFVERLNEDDRRKLEAVGGKERLDLIEQMLQQHWFEQLPFKLREDLALMSPEEKKAKLVKIREEDRERKKLLVASKGRPPVKRPDGKVEPARARPATLNQYPMEVIEFVNEHIKPRLTMVEWKKLDAADNHVSQLATLLVEYAERYPVLPPILSRPLPADLTELPADLRQKVNKGAGKLAQKFKAETEANRKQWPDFALAVVRFCNREGIPIATPLGASKPADFSVDVQAAIKKLPEGDRMTLQTLESKWPDYPLKLHEVARKAEIALPGMSLPGTRAYWDGLKKEK